jgi:DNA-binding NtrC family response regulator
MLGKVAPSRAVVLIKGESGTGKELAATTLHKMSGLADKPFVAVNCGAFPANLVEAELFGHERGGFTGAVRLKKGCFERAAGGTLLLDEVTEMPLDMQVKLLRVLETGRFCRVGGDQEVEFKVRVVCATNRCPDQAVKEGLLRSDLAYRLSVIPVELPALRDRGGDIDLLAQLFLDQLNADGGTAKVFSESSHQFLHAYSWPGNVRELKNLVDYLAATTTGGTIVPADFADRLISSDPVPADDERQAEQASPSEPLPMVGAPGAAPPPSSHTGEHQVRSLVDSVAEHERSSIEAALVTTGGNKTRAAKLLGVPLRTFMQKVKRHGIR